MAEYIDREALLKRFCNDDPANMEDYYNAIKGAPTVDVVEVKHGKYIAASKTAQIGLKCSLCGARIKYSEHFNGNHHYCYKCGAKMDGGNNEQGTKSNT